MKRSESTYGRMLQDNRYETQHVKHLLGGIVGVLIRTGTERLYTVRCRRSAERRTRRIASRGGRALALRATLASLHGNVTEYCDQTAIVYP